jgi:hypothetical protein
MFEKSTLFDEKVLSKQDLFVIRQIMQSMIQTVCSGSNALVEVATNFNDGSTYKSDLLNCFEDRYYDTLTASSVTMTCGDYTNFYIQIRMNKENITLSVKGRDRQWLGHTTEELSRQLNSLSSINYENSFFFKNYVLRITLVSLQCFAFMFALFYTYFKLFGGKNNSYNVAVALVLLMAQGALFFKLENKIPLFRKLWPQVEFDFGPIDNRAASIRRLKAVAVDKRVKWMTTVFLMPLIITFISIL